jgi:phage shock protein E
MSMGIVAAGLLLVSRKLKGTKVPPNVIIEKIRAGATVVDVRTPDEFRGGAYPGAVNIPLSDLSRRCSEIPRGHPVILYCASGFRSASALRLLRQAGFSDVVNAGGIYAMPQR